MRRRRGAIGQQRQVAGMPSLSERQRRDSRRGQPAEPLPSVTAGFCEVEAEISGDLFDIQTVAFEESFDLLSLFGRRRANIIESVGKPQFFPLVLAHFMER